MKCFPMHSTYPFAPAWVLGVGWGGELGFKLMDSLGCGNECSCLVAGEGGCRCKDRGYCLLAFLPPFFKLITDHVSYGTIARHKVVGSTRIEPTWRDTAKARMPRLRCHPRTDRRRLEEWLGVVFRQPQNILQSYQILPNFPRQSKFSTRYASMYILC